MVTLLRDPSEVRLYERRDPPPHKWPGIIIKRQDLMAAGGDPRDWFRYGHRLNAYRKVWDEYISASVKRRNRPPRTTWNQVIILGDYGSFKSRIGTLIGYNRFRNGSYFFHNASSLFGNRLQGDEMYTALTAAPKNSTFFFDEASNHFPSVLSASVAVASGSEQNLNTRKQNAWVIYASAHDWEISSRILRACKEVWIPVKPEDLHVGDPHDKNGSGRRRPADDPDNFVIAYHVWNDFPYRRANAYEGKQKDKSDGWGPPAYTVYDQGENVRQATVLNDTFELAAVGAARTADPERVKARLAAQLNGDTFAPSVDGQYTGLAAYTRDDELLNGLLKFLQAREYDPPEYIKAGDIARALRISPQKAGMLVQQLLTISPHPKGKGYLASEIYSEINKTEVNE